MQIYCEEIPGGVILISPRIEDSEDVRRLARQVNEGLCEYLEKNKILDLPTSPDSCDFNPGDNKTRKFSHPYAIYCCKSTEKSLILRIAEQALNKLN